MSYHDRLLTNKNIHDKTVRDVAERRFDNIKYDVYHNPGSEKNASVGTDANPLYPDIVVLEKGYRRRTAIAIGEIETEDSTNEKEAETQWEKFAKSKIPFYLYIPAGSVQKTTAILKKKSIEISGLRTYRYVDGELVVKNIT